VRNEHLFFPFPLVLPGEAVRRVPSSKLSFFFGRCQGNREAERTGRETAFPLQVLSYLQKEEERKDFISDPF